MRCNNDGMLQLVDDIKKNLRFLDDRTTTSDTTITTTTAAATIASSWGNDFEILLPTRLLRVWKLLIG